MFYLSPNFTANNYIAFFFIVRIVCKIIIESVKSKIGQLIRLGNCFLAQMVEITILCCRALASIPVSVI